VWRMPSRTYSAAASRVLHGVRCTHGVVWLRSRGWAALGSQDSNTSEHSRIMAVEQVPTRAFFTSAAPGSVAPCAQAHRRVYPRSRGFHLSGFLSSCRATC